ncbi:hypothetical protein Tco_0583240 [Tanacetum coccineum]
MPAYSAALRGARRAALSPETSSSSTSSSSSSDSASHTLKSSLTASLQDYATPTSSSSAGPSRKRSRSSATSISSAIYTARALTPARVNLLPPHKRYRGTSTMHLDKSGDDGSPETHTDSDMYLDIQADIKDKIAAAATTAAATVDGLDIEPFMARVGMGFELGLAVVEFESEPEEAEADDEADQLEQLEEGVQNLQARSLIADGERSSLLGHVVALEGSNMRLRDALGIKRVRADSLQRHLGYVEDELRQVRELRTYKSQRL